MPVYLFTFHAHGTWMPDRPRGYVKRNRGVLPADPDMADRYRARQVHPAITFDLSIQRLLVEFTLEACQHQSLRLHAVATNASHVHILVSWHFRKPVKNVRQNLKQSLTRRLNKRIHKAVWFSRGGSQKRVKDREHFDYLMTTYLPGHRGLCWFVGS